MSGRTVLILAPNWLGDAVMALPAVQDVRRHDPSARLIVAARPSVAPLFQMSPAVDEVLELEWRGSLWHIGALRRDAARLRALRADVAVLLPNSFASAVLVALAGVRDRRGYARDGRSVLLSRAVPAPRASQHQAGYYQQLVRELGIPNGPMEPALTIADAPRRDARALLTSAGWDEMRPLAVLAPGAAYGGAKRWPSSHFAKVAAALVADRGAHCVLIGSGADADATRAVREAVPAPLRERVTDLSGRTSLATLAAILSLAQVCISNDSGAMHLAAAAGVPLVALFGPTNEQETSPLPRAGTPAAILINPVSCRPCMLRECPIDHPCMNDLDPARVLDTVERWAVLARHPRAPRA